MKIMDMIFSGVKKLNERFSAKLGDRTKYIGASDIVSCPRRVYLSKIKGQSFGDKQVAVFLRGQLAEGLIVEALKIQNAKIQLQKEYQHPEYPFLLCHCDIVFENDKEIGIMEVKSGSIPDTPYTSWIEQLHFQMGLAKLNHPDKHVKGAVVVVDVKTGDIKVFNSYVAENVIFGMLTDKALKLWDNIQKREEPHGSVNDFCATCAFCKGCKAFNALEVTDIDNELKEKIKYLSKIKAEQKRLSCLEKEIKESILNVFDDGKYIIENNTISISTRKGRKYIDSKKLLEKYPEAAKDEEIYSVGNSYQVINISEIKK